MNYLTAVHSDRGIRKKTNQDSVLYKEASTDYGKIVFAVVCDGMGGLANGEIASASLIQAFSRWFEQIFPEMLYKCYGTEQFLSELSNSWNTVIQEMNSHITEYGLNHHTSLGTTVVALLLIENNYYTVNVGDSRVYLIYDQMYQLTKDQTYIQQQIELGNMTWEQAKLDPKRNVLLQCVGASDVIVPEYTTGQYAADQVFMLCTDGFRHLISNEEIFAKLNPQIVQGEADLKHAAVSLTELNKSRFEKDNISVIAIKTVG